MQSTTSKFLSELDNQLHLIKFEPVSQLKIVELSIESIFQSINKLKLYITKYKFQNEKEEIIFFKKIKPQFISKFIYYNYIYSFITQRPIGCSKMVKKYLNSELKTLHQFHEKNLDFCKYYRSGCEYLDHKYFVRGQFDLKINHNSAYFESDVKFSTNRDFLVSNIMANDLIELFLKNEITSLDNLENGVLKPEAPKSSLKWTAPKAAIIELLYAFHADGCFNNGNASITQIATAFESAFNIELGQYSRTFLEINARKTGRTKYLDSLKEKLLKRMDEADGDV